MMQTTPTLFLAVGEPNIKVLDYLRALNVLPNIWQFVTATNTLDTSTLWAGLQKIVSQQNIHEAMTQGLILEHYEPRLALICTIDNLQETASSAPDNSQETVSSASLPVLTSHTNMFDTLRKILDVKKQHEEILVSLEITLFLLHNSESDLSNNLRWLTGYLCRSYPELIPVQIWVVDQKNKYGILSLDYMMSQMAKWLYLWASQILGCPSLLNHIRENQAKASSELLLATGSFGIEEIPFQSTSLSNKLATRFYYECIYPVLQDTTRISPDIIPLPEPISLEAIQNKLQQLINDGIGYQEGDNYVTYPAHGKGISWIKKQLEQWMQTLSTRILQLQYRIEKIRWSKSADEFRLRILPLIPIHIVLPKKIEIPVPKKRHWFIRLLLWIWYIITLPIRILFRIIKAIVMFVFRILKAIVMWIVHFFIPEKPKVVAVVQHLPPPPDPRKIRAEEIKRLRAKVNSARQQLLNYDKELVHVLEIQDNIRCWIAKLDFNVAQERDSFSSLLNSVYQSVLIRLQQEFMLSLRAKIYNYIVTESGDVSFFKILLEKIQARFVEEIARVPDLQSKISEYIEQDVNPVINWRLDNNGAKDFLEVVRLSETMDFPHEFTICLPNKPDTLWITRIIQLDIPGEIYGRNIAQP